MFLKNTNKSTADMVTKTRLGYVFIFGFTVIVGDVTPESGKL